MYQVSKPIFNGKPLEASTSDAQGNVPVVRSVVKANGNGMQNAEAEVDDIGEQEQAERISLFKCLDIIPPALRTGEDYANAVAKLEEIWALRCAEKTVSEASG